MSEEESIKLVKENQEKLVLTEKEFKK